MNINFIQVFDYELNISKRLNETIERLPNDWICLTDQDTLKFEAFPNNLKTLLECETISELDLIGSTTNRLRRGNPQVIEALFHSSDINEHSVYSIEAWEKYGVELLLAKIIAGSCMVFHRSLWEKVGGFDESKIFFDKYFSYAVSEFGGRCLIAKGLYVFHLYRWNADNPEAAVNHLVKKKPTS